MKTKISVTAIIGGLILLIAENLQVFAKLAEYAMQTPTTVHMILIPYIAQIITIVLTKAPLPESFRRMLMVTALGRICGMRNGADNHAVHANRKRCKQHQRNPDRLYRNDCHLAGTFPAMCRWSAGNGHAG